MSYTPTNWQNYPDSRATPITAAELNRIDNGVAEALAGMSDLQQSLANYQLYGFMAIEQDRTNLRHIELLVSNYASLLSDDPYYDIDGSYIDTSKDGLLIYRNRYTFIEPPAYHFVTQQNEDIRVQFGSNVHFDSTETLTMWIFVKPSYVKSSSVADIWTGTQAQYDALSTHDSSTLYIIEEASS